MEENASYMYGTELMIGLEVVDEETEWMYLLGKVFEDMLASIRNAYIEDYGKLIGYDVKNNAEGITIRIMAGSEEVIKDIEICVKEQTGIRMFRRKFRMYPPTLSHKK